MARALDRGADLGEAVTAEIGEERVGDGRGNCRATSAEVRERLRPMCCGCARCSASMAVAARSRRLLQNCPSAMSSARRTMRPARDQAFQRRIDLCGAEARRDEQALRRAKPIARELTCG